ncbi:MAG: hypothetical protein FWF53_12555 [Candidatus Azobacteroides sp.]|nr:hypothetical protein [Candidatus Azobacteroides sp.]
MKKILISISIFLFTATMISYAGFFNESWDVNCSEAAFDNYGGFSESDNNCYSSGFFNNYDEISDDYNGFFRASSAGDPGGRPGNGDGIGQEAPIDDGLLPLTVCCVVLIFVKAFYKRRKNKINKE